jgi:hypothetical protein
MTGGLLGVGRFDFDRPLALGAITPKARANQSQGEPLIVRRQLRPQGDELLKLIRSE